MAVCGRGQFRVHRFRLPIDLPTVKNGNGSNIRKKERGKIAIAWCCRYSRLPPSLSFPPFPLFDPIRRAQFSRLSFCSECVGRAGEAGVYCSPANKHFFRSAFAEEQQNSRKTDEASE